MAPAAPHLLTPASTLHLHACSLSRLSSFDPLSLLHSLPVFQRDIGTHIRLHLHINVTPLHLFTPCNFTPVFLPSPPPQPPSHPSRLAWFQRTFTNTLSYTCSLLTPLHWFTPGNFTPAHFLHLYASLHLLCTWHLRTCSHFHTRQNNSNPSPSFLHYTCLHLAPTPPYNFTLTRIPISAFLRSSFPSLHLFTPGSLTPPHTFPPPRIPLITCFPSLFLPLPTSTAQHGTRPHFPERGRVFVISALPGDEAFPVAEALIKERFDL